MCLVAGEPGIGKSRLIDEFASGARRRGVQVLWGRCWEAGGAPPFWPWIECLREHLDRLDPERLARYLGSGAPDMARMLPDIRRALPDVPEPPNLDPDTARFRLFDAAAAFLREGGEDEPLVLVLDDIHAADEPSLLLLRFLGQHLGSARVLLVAAYRDTELTGDHPLTDAAAELARDPATVRLFLRGLTEGDVAVLIEAATGRTPSSGVAAAVHAETEGNPLFVGELLRLLAAEGRLEQAANDASWRALIPQGVREVIGMRLGRLSPRCVEVLTLASVVGREFGMEVLERLDEGEDLLEVLDEAAAVRVLGQVPGRPGRLRFSHALIRDAVYQGLAPGRRARLHREVGRALEQLYGADPGPYLAELAHHFFEAASSGEAGQAVSYCLHAGRRAASVLAYEEAVRLLRMAVRALELHPEPDDAIRCDVLLALGDALARAGDERAAKEAFLETAEVAERAGLAERLATAALGYGGRFVWLRASADRRIVPLLEQALRSLAEEYPELRARLMARLAGALRDDPNPARRDELSAGAVEIARGLADPSTLGYVLDGRWAAIWGPDTTEERLALADELIRAGEAAGDEERTFQGHHYRMVCLWELGDLSGVKAELAVKERIAAALQQPAQHWYLLACLALLDLFEGRLQGAEERLAEAHRIGERALAWNAEFTHRLQLFALRREQGRLGEMEEVVRRSVVEYPSYPFVHALLGLVQVEVGLPEEATGAVEALMPDGRLRLPRDNEWLLGVSVLAEVVAAVGDENRARRLYEELLPYGGRNILGPIEMATGSAARPLGLLAASMGQADAAEAHLDKAVRANRRMRADPWTARTLLDHARFLVDRDGLGDRDRAMELARAGLELARRIGSVATARAIEGLYRRIGEQPPGYERPARTFMFTDVVGSTSLVEILGDEAWQDLRRWHDRTLRDLFREHGGEEVDHAGDGFFVAFEDPRAAVRCAVAIQRRLAEHRETQGFAPAVRIGLHHGEATRGEGEYSGRVVHEAARIAGLAGAGEILASTAVLVAGAGDVEARDPRTVTLRGVRDAVEVQTIDWGRGT